MRGFDPIQACHRTTNKHDPTSTCTKPTTRTRMSMSYQVLHVTNRHANSVKEKQPEIKPTVHRIIKLTHSAYRNATSRIN
jgi:hypothetical protein